MAESIFDTSELIELRKSERIDIAGYTTIISLIEFPRAVEFERLRVLYPMSGDYETALLWAEKLLEKGKPLPASDLIIAAVSSRMGLVLITRDRHFREIKGIAKEFKVEIKRS